MAFGTLTSRMKRRMNQSCSSRSRQDRMSLDPDRDDVLERRKRRSWRRERELLRSLSLHPQRPLSPFRVASCYRPSSNKIWAMSRWTARHHLRSPNDDRLPLLSSRREGRVWPRLVPRSPEPKRRSSRRRSSKYAASPSSWSSISTNSASFISVQSGARSSGA